MLRHWLDRLEALLVIVIAGFLFLPNAVPTMSLAVLALISLYRFGFSTLAPKHIYILLVPALLMVIAWAGHGAPRSAANELQLWLLWPAAILYFRQSTYKTLFLKSSVWWSVLQGAYVLLIIITNEAVIADIGVVGLRDAIGFHFKIHPTYMSTVWLWAACLVLIHATHVRFMDLGLVVLLMVPSLVCGGKMPLLAFLAVAVYKVLNDIGNKVYKAWLLGVIILFGALNIWINPFISSRFAEISKMDTHYEEGRTLSSTDLRVGIWLCAKDLAMEHWLTGLGTGNVRPALEECYSSYDHDAFFATEYNAHNQYLHFWLSGGIGSFVIFMAYYVFLFIESRRNKNTAFTAFLLYFALIMLTENYFSRQSGMLLWSFMAASLFFSDKRGQLSDSSIETS